MMTLLLLLGLILLQLLIRLLIPVTQLPRPIRLLPQLLPELPLPPANSRLILNPEPMLLVVRGIRIVATNVHQPIIDANVLGVAQVGGPVVGDASDFEMAINECIDVVGLSFVETVRELAYFPNAPR